MNTSTPPTSESRPRLPGPMRRTMLLEAALARFAQKGYHGSSMEEIAEAAGVTKPVLYQHFPSKHDLYSELLESVANELTEQVISAALAESQPYRRLLAGLESYFKFVCERADAFQLLFGSVARPTDDFKDPARGIEDGFAATIAELIHADVGQDHRELLACGIVGLAEVTGRRWVAQSEGGSPLRAEVGARFAQQLADLVWAGLRGLPGYAPTERDS